MSYTYREKNNLNTLLDNPGTTNRIVQYRDDPNKSSALAEIKRLSIRARKQNSSKDINKELEEMENTLENTEKNRLLFKNIKEEKDDEDKIYKKEKGKNEEIPQKGKFISFKRPNYSLLKRKKVHFMDSKLNNNTSDNIRINKENENDFNINTNKTNNTINNLNVIDNYRNKYKNNQIIDNSNKSNQSNKSRNYNINSDSLINDYVVKYNSMDDDYKYKNNIVIERSHNKDRLIVNEYHSKSKSKNKNKKDLKKYKTEYIWDKNINRIVEKRIYSDDEDNDDKDNNKENKDKNNNDNKSNKIYNININDNNNKKEYVSNLGKKVNLYEDKEDENKNNNNEEIKKEKNKNILDKNNENKKEKEILKAILTKIENKNLKLKEKEKDKEKKEEENEKNEKKNNNNKEKLLEYKIEHIKKEKNDPEILKGKDNKVIEIKKRLGNCKVIFKKEQKLLKNKDKKDNKDNKEIDKEIFKEKENYRTLDNKTNKPKELNKNNYNPKFYRKDKIYSYKDNNYNEEQNQKQEKYKYNKIRNPNNTYTEIVEEKIIIIDDDNKIKPKIEINKYKYNPEDKIYKLQRQFTNSNDDLNSKIQKSSFEERKYFKKSPNPPLNLNPRGIYTRKRIEDKKPDRKEILIENESNAPNGYPNNFKKKNIRIKMTNEKIDDDNKYNYNLNTNLQKYNKNSKYVKFGNDNKWPKNDSEYFNNSGSLEKYKKKELIPSYDNINDENEDDYKNNEGNNLRIKKYVNIEKPYYKKKIINDERKGRNSKNNYNLKRFSKSLDYDDN